MKKCISFLLLSVMLLFLVPAQAFESPETRFAYDVSYSVLYAEIDPSAAEDPDSFPAVLSAIPGVAGVEDMKTGILGSFHDGDPEKYLYKILTLESADAETYVSVEAALRALPGVRRLSQSAKGIDLKRGCTFALDCIDIDAQTSQGVDAVIADVLTIPGVCRCECHDMEYETDPYKPESRLIIWLWEKNLDLFTAVVGALAEKPYCLEFWPEYYIPASRPYTYGDVTLDYKVSAADARAVLRFCVGLDAPVSYLVRTLADVNFDGKITAADARGVLRIAVGLDPKNTYTEEKPDYKGVIVSASVNLTKSGGRLQLSAATVGNPSVTKCGFSCIKLQKLVNGVWTDETGHSHTDRYTAGNSAVFAETVSVPAGTYRLVCTHYAEFPFLLSTKNVTLYAASAAVTL